MKARPARAVTLGIFGLCLLAVMPSWAAELSFDEVLARHTAAVGPADQLKAIETLTLIGKYRPGGYPADLAMKETIKRPASVRIELTLQGFTIVQAYDGKSGWQIQPFQGRKDAERMTTDDVKSIDEENQIEGFLVNAAAKGTKLDYLGREDVDGTNAYVIRAQLKNGNQKTVYLDPDAFLPIRILTKAKIRGAEVETETDLGDYEKIEGVYLPFSIQNGAKGSTRKDSITYERADVNKPVDDKIFAFPVAAVATKPKQ
jgi:outer membrane lipoprotein-sorting protein